MILGALDIGSNAARFQICRVIDYKGKLTFRKVEHIRYPLRLGEDVFENGIISEKRIKKLEELCVICKHMMGLYEVDLYSAYATSAFREAKNKNEVIDRVFKKSNINIEVINGHKEANLINKVIKQNIDSFNYIHIDVGGGSTELNIYVNKKKKYSESFKIGTIRDQDKIAKSDDWKLMKKWINKICTEFKIDHAIGTGGNIRKLHELSGKKEGKPISKRQIKDIQDNLNGYSLEERIKLLQMNADRADVILPASFIYHNVMKWSKTDKIFVPAVGLKDGMFLELYEKIKGK